LDSSTARLTAVDSADPPPYRRRVRGHFYHSPNRPRTGTPGVARVSATGPAAVLALQRSLGNRAVRQVLQRAPTGLREATPTTDYTNDALAYWRDPANQSKGLGEYAIVLAARANASLASIGVSQMKPVIDTNACYHGAFDWTDWKIRMNIARWSKSTKIEDTADEIQKALGFKDPQRGDGRRRVAARQLVRQRRPAHRGPRLGGDHARLPRAVSQRGQWMARRDAEAHGRDPRDRGPADEGLEHRAHDHLGHPRLAHECHAREVPRRPSQVHNKKKPKTPGDAVVLTHIKTIESEMGRLDKEWRKIKRTWDKDGLNTRLQNVIGFKTPLYALYRALQEAYEAQTHETDGLATGEAVSAQFKAAAAPKAPPAKVPARSAP
jgi:hypothetical protein